jgi:hypothetical protein
MQSASHDVRGIIIRMGARQSHGKGPDPEEWEWRPCSGRLIRSLCVHCRMHKVHHTGAKPAHSGAGMRAVIRATVQTSPPITAARPLTLRASRGAIEGALPIHSRCPSRHKRTDAEWAVLESTVLWICRQCHVPARLAFFARHVLQQLNLLSTCLCTIDGQ